MDGDIKNCEVRTAQQDRQLDRRFALMQLSDQFFPSGSFTLSHGLETLVQTQHVQSAEDLYSFLRLLLHNKVGSSDLVAVSQAYRASVTEDFPALCAIDAALYAQTPIQAVRDTQRRSGRAILMVATSVWQNSQLSTLSTHVESGQMQGLHPILFAAIGQVAGLTEEDTLFAFLHGFLGSLCSAGIRLGVLGHIKAQIILKDMATDLETLACRAKSMELADIWSGTPFLDIAQMTHGQLPRKLFMN